MNSQHPLRPNEFALEQPNSPGKWWFHGNALSGLTCDRVQNRPLMVDEGMALRDANTGQRVTTQLVGWWTRDEDMKK